MGLEFRRRDYRAEEHAHALLRTRNHTHPLSTSSSASHQVEESEGAKDDFSDPLRATDGTAEASVNAIHLEDVSSNAAVGGYISSQMIVRKEWISFKKMLMQRFPSSKTRSISMVSGVIVRGVNRATETSSKDIHSEELDDQRKFEEEDTMVISQQECLKKLQELKDEINQSWCADDRVTSLRLAVKAARLLMDSSVIQFYPTLFVLVTDIMDMLGDLVWDRIKQKTEMTEEGGILSLPDNFKAGDISFDAKETCNNWFSKISSVPELLPRIYLELAILPCWLFLNDHHDDILQRLVKMTRGLADPLTSAYCRLYLVQCAQRLPHHDTGFLITCINDLKLLLMHITPAKEAVDENLSGDTKLLLTLVEPTIEYILKCLFKDLKQMDISNLLVSLGMRSDNKNSFENYSCSIILHYILKELPIGFTCSNAIELLHLIETTDDGSFNQSFNFKLLGQRLCEMVHKVSQVQLVVDKIIQILSCYGDHDAFLMVSDAYLDIILENQLGTYLNVILDGILERLSISKIGENGLLMLQSIFMKTISHFGSMEKILALNHFVDILEMMHGSSRSSINMHILSMATRSGQIHDPPVIEVLLEVSHALYDDFSNMRNDDYQHPSRLICRFVYMVDHGTDVQSHLRFLARCRGAFSTISELQEILVHSSNNLAVKAMRDGNSNISFVKSCLAFNEVTVPAIPSSLRQLKLYIETAEVALLGGYISHADGLIYAAVNCLPNVDQDNVLQTVEEGDMIISLICKLCAMLVMVPGSLEQGITWIHKLLLSFLDSQSWIVPGMKAKILLAVIFLCAAQSQNQLPYSREVIGNFNLFYGVQSYHAELLSFSGGVLQDIVNIVMQESSKAVRGNIALEACNCVASSFTMSEETLEACSKLLEIGKSCLSESDKFLQSTLKFLDAQKFYLNL